MNIGGELRANETVLLQAGVFVTTKGILIGWVLIPTKMVVEAGGTVAKVKVWTSHVIVTTIDLVNYATKG